MTFILFVSQQVLYLQGSQSVCCNCRGTFTIDTEAHSIQDTFLSVKTFCRGMAWVNGNNLGRFWSAAGPQLTLYIPKTFLQSGVNELVVLELERVPEERHVDLVAAPDFSGTPESSVQ